MIPTPSIPKAAMLILLGHLVPFFGPAATVAVDVKPAGRHNTVQGGGTAKIPFGFTCTAAPEALSISGPNSKEVITAEAAAQSREIVPIRVGPGANRDSKTINRFQKGFAGRFIQLERKPRLGLNLSYELEAERRKGPFIDTRDISHRFRERLTVETRGSVYHPALLKFTMRLEPEFNQIIEDHDPGEDIRDTPFLPNYFAEATLLAPKPYTLRVFGSRSETTLRSAFAESSDTTIDTFGADLFLKYRILPTTIGYVHRESDQTGFFDSQEDRDDFRLTTRHFTQRTNTVLNSTFSDSSRISDGVITDITTANNNIQNDFDIGGDKKKTLNSFLNYRISESNTFDTSDLRLTEQFNWRHTETLRTNYNFTYNTNESGGFNFDSLFFGAGLTHLLYENLTTNFGADATFNDFTGGEEDIYGTHLTFAYRRKIPWGRLTLNTGFDYKVTARQGGDVLIQVSNEPHVLSTGEVTLLQNNNVDIDAIVVTNEAGSIVYVEGIDYTVEPFDASVRISRIPFGAIADGQLVLVSYQFLSDPSFDDAVFRQSYGGQLNLWNALSLSYGFRKADQDILSGPEPSNRADETTHFARLRFDWRWTNTRLTFEDTDRLSGVSTRRWMVEEELIFRPLKPLFFTLKGFFGQTEFKERTDTEDFYGVRSRIEWLPAQWCKLGVNGFREEISGDLNKTVDTAFAVRLELSYRIWTGLISYRFLDEEDKISGEERIRHSAVFEIARGLW